MKPVSTATLPVPPPVRGPKARAEAGGETPETSGPGKSAQSVGHLAKAMNAALGRTGPGVQGQAASMIARLGYDAAMAELMALQEVPAGEAPPPGGTPPEDSAGPAPGETPPAEIPPEETAEGGTGSTEPPPAEIPPEETAEGGTGSTEPPPAETSAETAALGILMQALDDSEETPA